MGFIAIQAGRKFVETSAIEKPIVAMTPEVLHSARQAVETAIRDIQSSTIEFRRRVEAVLSSETDAIDELERIMDAATLLEFVALLANLAKEVTDLFAEEGIAFATELGGLQWAIGNGFIEVDDYVRMALMELSGLMNARRKLAGDMVDYFLRLGGLAIDRASRIVSGKKVRRRYAIDQNKFSAEESQSILKRVAEPSPEAIEWGMSRARELNLL